MPKFRNRVAVVLSTIAGILLIVSGTRGPIGIYEFMLENLPLFINSELLFSIVKTAVLVLLSISLLGGFVVIAGGYLILKIMARLVSLQSG